MRHFPCTRSGPLRQFLLLCLCVSLLTTALLACARVHAAEDPEEMLLENARQQLTAIERTLAQPKDDINLLDLRAQALTLQSQLQEATTRIAPQLAQIEARIAELGAAPQTSESSDVAKQRRELEQKRASFEGRIKLAKLLSLEAEQAAGRISARSRTQFRQHLGDRTSSVLGPTFWTNLKAEVPRDTRRARAFVAEVRTALPAASPMAWVGALIATVVILGVQVWLMRKLPPIAPPGRLRRSLRAFVRVLLPTLSAVVIAYVIGLALTSGEEPTPHFAEALRGVGVAALFGVYVAALGTALLSVRAPTWRLPDIPDDVAVRLQRSTVQFAVVIVLISLVQQLASAINVSLQMSVALDSLMTFALAATLARALRAAQTRDAASAKSSGEQVASASATPPLWFAVIRGIGWVIVVGSALCVLLGYIALGSFAVQQAAWAVIVLCTAYLLASVVDDVLMADLFVTRAKLKQQPVGAAQTSTAVLLSALARFTIALLALALMLAPFGAGAIDLLPYLHRLQDGISVGAIQLRPGAVIRGILILVLGIGAVRVVRRWTERRYLPATSMDAGMRASVTSMVGYVGYGIVIALTLSALGVGLQQIAWVASALALGIGFGLQAIVQNFVSGLILIAERPIKVGDWVAFGTFEGDVRRINARATEIQTSDRSIVIVPNSEFITKVVRNVTYANPIGLVQILLPMPLGTDVERVTAEFLQAFQSHADILRTPEPTVMLDGIEGVNILFNARGFVISPRVAYGTRSAILFDVLARLKQAGIIITSPTEVAVQPPAADEQHA